MYQEGRKVFIEPSDQCNHCRDLETCQLMEALFTGMVALQYETVAVKNCGKFVDTRPKLKTV